jgi:hypothetical protein
MAKRCDTTWQDLTQRLADSLNLEIGRAPRSGRDDRAAGGVRSVSGGVAESCETLSASAGLLDRRGVPLTGPAKLPSPNVSVTDTADIMESTLGLFSGRDRRQVAVVVTTDGRRVHLPVGNAPLFDVAFLELLRSLGLGLAGLLGLITGSRRENGGRRRDDRD